MFRRRKRVVVLYWYPTDLRPAIRHHLEALKYSTERHVIIYLNGFHGGFPTWLRYLNFDVVLLHTTLLGARWSCLYPIVRWQLDWLRSHPCAKIALPQDEYDHAEILDEWLHYLGVGDVFTNFDARFRETLYPIMHNRARFHECFTGYIDSDTAAAIQPRLRPLAERKLDIVYRANHLPYCFGSHGQLKHRIASIVKERAEALGLACDISTRREDTITTDSWFDFLASSRTIIGIESGSSVLDARGQIMHACRRLVEQNPDISFEAVSELMPANWDVYRFFALGPRHFEAVFTRTVQVLVEGEYNGVLLPNRHYIPLRRDFKNLDEVLGMVRDTGLLERLAENAYHEIYASGRYTYTALARQLDQAMTLPRPRVPLPMRLVPRISLDTFLRLVEVKKRLPHYQQRASAGWRRWTAVMSAGREWAGRVARKVRNTASGLKNRIGARLHAWLWKVRYARNRAIHLNALVFWKKIPRRLLATFLTSQRGCKDVTLRNVVRDLLVLKAVTQQPPLFHADKPRVYLVCDTFAGEVRLSRIDPAGTATPVAWSELKAELLKNNIKSFVWDRADPTEVIRLSLRNAFPAFYYLGNSAVYRFTALERLYEYTPRLIVQLLEETLGEFAVPRLRVSKAGKKAG
jgi:hypothetical protein